MADHEQRENEATTDAVATRRAPRRFQRTVFAVTALTIVAIGGVELWLWADDHRAESTAGNEAVVEITWETLVPEGYTPPTNPLDNMTPQEIDKLLDGSDESNRELAELDKIMSFAPVVPDLDGKRVKLAGYVVPLDFDGQTRLNEFLVVPYYGACIHTPPPPANQVVHALAKRAVTVEDQYLPVWATGILQTRTTVSNLAEAGYKLQIEKVEPYQQQ